MDKYGTRSLAQVKACDAYDVKPGVRDPGYGAQTCGTCAHYNELTRTRVFLCPFKDQTRPEDGDGIG